MLGLKLNHVSKRGHLQTQWWASSGPEHEGDRSLKGQLIYTQIDENIRDADIGEHIEK